jgi:hypothetical protein
MDRMIGGRVWESFFWDFFGKGREGHFFLFFCTRGTRDREIFFCNPPFKKKEKKTGH